MTATIAAPDAERFPLSGADRALARRHGMTLVEFDGHDAASFSARAPDALGTLAWGGRYDRAVFDALPHLRVIARCGAGFDNIDLREADERGIVTTYCPGVFDRAVAEHVIASLFAVARRIPESDAAVRAGLWPSAADLSPMRSVSTMTLGLVGFGRIARQVARFARGLGMRVLAVDPFTDVDPTDAEPLATLEALLAAADAVSLHAPLTDATRGMIGAAQLARMRTDAILINTGRGELVDGAALAEALRTGTIAGAALDVFSPEPLAAGHPLRAAPNCVLTPHSSAFDDEALAAARLQAIGDSIAVIEGRAPRFRVESAA